MLPALLALNIIVWLAVLAYSLRLFSPLARRWSVPGVLVCLIAAGALSFASYQYAARHTVKQKALQHYYAGIDERQRGNLQEAERQFQESLTLQPGNPDAQRQLQEIRDQKPAESREVRRDAAIDPSASPAPSQSTQTSQPPAPANTPAANSPAPAPPPPPPGKPGEEGEKPKPAPHKPSPFEIIHYALDVEIDPAAHTLAGTATIRVRSRGEKVSALDFSLNPEFKAVSAQMEGQSAPHTHVNDLLTVRPRRALGGGKEATVIVKYRREGSSPLVQGGDLIATRGTYLRSEARWYPATGELDFRSPVSVRARVPKEYSVVSVGALKGVTKSNTHYTYHWETDRFASMVSLAAAKYVQQSVTLPSTAPGGKPLQISCYTLPEHKNRAPAFLKEASAITKYFEKQFGAYPYEKLAVVEIPLFPGGYGTTSFVMLIDKSFEEKKVDREFLAHEIAHQWWGNSVFPQGLGAAWLTEAFANYSAWMYESAITGNPRVLQKRVTRATQEFFVASAEKGDQPVYETDPYQPLGAVEAVLYEKGAVVLHMLQRQVGDRPFLKILRAFADDHRFGKAKIEDFQKIAERESGQDLQWFFDQWLGRKGGMTFAYSFTTEPDTPQQNQAVLTITQAKPAYRARMNVVLQVENSVQTRTIEISEEEQTFRFPVKGKVTNVLFDPESTYLMKPPRWVVK